MAEKIDNVKVEMVEKIDFVASKVNRKFDEIGGRIDNMEAMLKEVLDLMSAPTVSTPVPSSTPTVPPSICADKTEEFAIGNSIRPWCKILAASKNEKVSLKRCKQYDLWDHCPVTCGVCS